MVGVVIVASSATAWTVVGSWIVMAAVVAVDLVVAEERIETVENLVRDLLGRAP